MPLTPTLDAYMGGGMRLLPRDFMKLGQLHLNGGTWNGRRVLSPEWVRRATSHLIDQGTRKYGYFWYVEEYPFEGRSVRAFMAAGNGGQILMGIPELDLLLLFYGGNYSDASALVPQRIYVPQYILPLIEKGR
jgi:CubicO group peptidase (beta-lactamase class C family)